VSKGMSQTIGLAIVAFFAVALVMNIGIERVVELDDRISLNTVPLVTERVEIAIYGLETTPEGSNVELELRDEYNVTEENDGSIAYRFDSYLPNQDETNIRTIDPPGDSRVTIGDEGRSKYICIEKTGSITVNAGEC
jgi:hypothetical protein